MQDLLLHVPYLLQLLVDPRWILGRLHRIGVALLLYAQVCLPNRLLRHSLYAQMWVYCSAMRCIHKVYTLNLRLRIIRAEIDLMCIGFMCIGLMCINKGLILVGFILFLLEVLPAVHHHALLCHGLVADHRRLDWRSSLRCQRRHIHRIPHIINQYFGRYRLVMDWCMRGLMKRDHWSWWHCLIVWTILIPMISIGIIHILRRLRSMRS